MSEDSNSLFPRETRRQGDPGNETIVFESGWIHLNRGWFCKVSMQDICVEDFATTKSGALRRARRAWKKTKAKMDFEQFGYPRACDG